MCQSMVVITLAFDQPGFNSGQLEAMEFVVEEHLLVVGSFDSKSFLLDFMDKNWIFLVIADIIEAITDFIVKITVGAIANFIVGNVYSGYNPSYSGFNSYCNY